ncbi:MAG: NDP-sugar synthase [Candidatus Saganbacteria bacterium]|nr:NDP-sugar synthase [Candidatus Saganbacteria bacterium]
MTQKAVILAAGNSRRMLPVSLEIPKPLLTLGDQTLIDLTMKRLKYLAFVDTLYASVGYQQEKVSGHFIKIAKALNLKYGVFTDETLPGTSYWLFRNKDCFLNGPLSGDALWVSTIDNAVDVDFKEVREDFERQNKPACMLVSVPSELRVDHGDFFVCDKSYKVIKMLDLSENPAEKLSENIFLSSGLQIINPIKILQLVRGNSYNNFRDLWEFLYKKGEVYISKTTPNQWGKIDRIEDWMREKELCKNGKSPFIIRGVE